MRPETPIATQRLLSIIRDVAERDKWAAVAACDAALEAMAFQPELAPFHAEFRQEAEWWAEFAPESMKVSYLAAILRALEARPPVAAGPRKRALVAIWNSLTPAERAAFLAHVEEHSGERTLGPWTTTTLSRT